MIRRLGPPWWICVVIAVYALMSGSVLADQSPSEQWTGVASVIDGDTIEVRGVRIRFDGVDAPEARQICTKDGKSWRCGAASANALHEYLGRRTVKCQNMGTDRYKRMIGRCSVGDTDLNSWLVRHGWALDYEKYSGGLYRAEEEAARAAKDGIWSSTFVVPWDWRRGAR